MRLRVVSKDPMTVSRPAARGHYVPRMRRRKRESRGGRRGRDALIKGRFNGPTNLVDIRN